MSDATAATASTISSGALKKLLVVFAELGVDSKAVLEEARVEPNVVDDVDARIPIATLHAAWESVHRRVPRDDAALLAASRYSPSDYGLVGFVAMTCATLGEALDQVFRYVGLWTDEPTFVLEKARLLLEYRTPFPDGIGIRRANEAAFAEVVNAARLLTQTDLAPREVAFAHEAPADVRAFEEFFKCPVHFGRPEASMTFAEESLALRMPQVDPKLGEFLRARANEALAQRGEPPEESPLAKVREIVAEELQRGVPSLGQVAGRLGTSERTLRRRLEEAGTSFRDIVDETRATVAQDYVREGRVALAEVAFLVGFSETSAFNRAFKRWTGLPPSSWRDQQREQQRG